MIMCSQHVFVANSDLKVKDLDMFGWGQRNDPHGVGRDGVVAARCVNKTV